MISDATKKLIERANELREKEIARVRARAVYYDRQNKLYETLKAAKAVAISMRGTAGEIDALRAWLEVDVEMNAVERPNGDIFSDEDWRAMMRKAWKALADDAGLHLSFPEESGS